MVQAPGRTIGAGQPIHTTANVKSKGINPITVAVCIGRSAAQARLGCGRDVYLDRSARLEVQGARVLRGGSYGCSWTASAEVERLAED